jgi:GNAT superfamily N-acetyltransferase
VEGRAVEGRAVEVRGVAASLVEPLLPALREEGLKPDLSDGTWLGALEGDALLGVARVLERDGHTMLEDVYVRPEARRRGVASALVAAATERSRRVWLMCDEDMVAYYSRRGFAAPRPEEFPPPLAALYAAKGEWPGRGHVHVAMRRG